MKVKVKEKDAEHKVDLESGARVKNALESAGINKETVIIERNGQVVSSQEKLRNGEKIKTISIVSGG